MSNLCESGSVANGHATITSVLQAVKEYSTLIDHLLFEVTGCLSQSQIKLLGAVLHQRASIYEQLEAYEASLQDFCQLQKLHPSDALVSRATKSFVAAQLDCGAAGSSSFLSGAALLDCGAEGQLTAFRYMNLCCLCTQGTTH